MDALKTGNPETRTAQSNVSEASAEAEKPAVEKPFERPFSKPKSGLFSGFTDDDGIDVPVFLRRNNNDQ